MSGPIVVDRELPRLDPGKALSGTLSANTASGVYSPKDIDDARKRRAEEAALDASRSANNTKPLLKLDSAQEKDKGVVAQKPKGNATAALLEATTSNVVNSVGSGDGLLLGAAIAEAHATARNMQSKKSNTNGVNTKPNKGKGADSPDQKVDTPNSNPESDLRLARLLIREEKKQNQGPESRQTRRGKLAKNTKGLAKGAGVELVGDLETDVDSAKSQTQSVLETPAHLGRESFTAKEDIFNTEVAQTRKTSPFLIRPGPGRGQGTAMRVLLDPNIQSQNEGLAGMFGQQADGTPIQFRFRGDENRVTEQLGEKINPAYRFRA